jgi:hypothetical protein
MRNCDYYRLGIVDVNHVKWEPTKHDPPRSGMVWRSVIWKRNDTSDGTFNFLDKLLAQAEGRCVVMIGGRDELAPGRWQEWDIRHYDRRKRLRASRKTSDAGIGVTFPS